MSNNPKPGPPRLFRPFPDDGVRDAHDIDHVGPHGQCAQSHIDEDCTCPDPTAHLFDGRMEYICLCCDGTVGFEEPPSFDMKHPRYQIPHEPS